MRAWHRFAARRLSEALPYLILDARNEEVREAGAIARQAMLIAIGVDCDGRRKVPGVEVAKPREPVELAHFLDWPAPARPRRRPVRSSVPTADANAARRCAPGSRSPLLPIAGRPISGPS